MQYLSAYASFFKSSTNDVIDFFHCLNVDMNEKI